MESSRTSALFSSVFPARNPRSFPLGPSSSRSNPLPSHSQTHTHTGISCCSRRRHHRRRDMGVDTRQRSPYLKDGSSADDTKSARLHNDAVVLTLDTHHAKQRLEALSEAAKKAVDASSVQAVRVSKAILNDGRMFLDDVRSSISSVQPVRVSKAILNDGRMFLEDLRSSVSIQRDRRVVISLRRSSIDFALSALLWSALLIVAWKLLVKAAKRYRWGWEESFDAHQVRKRDRSLAGREVFVGSNTGIDRKPGREKQGSVSARRSTNPLDAIEISRSEKDLVKQKESKSSRKLHNQLPGWWPPATPLSTTSPPGDEALQEKASFLLKMIIAKRSTGKDFEVDDILQLRRSCIYSGAKVAFDSAYERDSFYRAAVDMVLSSCGRSRKLGIDMGGEKAGEFLAGLSDNINLEAERAAVLVNAAVAARTRSTFLQAWALQVQGKFAEAEGDLARLSYILAALPPDHNSPEMEMVAHGLGQHLSSDERSRLLEIYVKAGGSSTERIAAEALGLHSTRKRT